MKKLHHLTIAAPLALLFTLSVPMTFAAAAVPVAAAPKDAGGVKKGLGMMKQAATETARLVDGKQYDQIPKAHDNVLDAKQILDNSLSVGEKTKVDATVIKAVAASTTLKDAAASKDDEKANAAQAAFADAVAELLVLFPEDMQPGSAK